MLYNMYTRVFNKLCSVNLKGHHNSSVTVALIGGVVAAEAVVVFIREEHASIWQHKHV